MSATLTFEKPNRTPDFQDCFTGKNAHLDKTPKELAALALANSPGWFRVLFAMRQKLASIVGLRTKTPDGKNPGVSFLLSLPVIQDDETAYEAGLADKHLDFILRIEKHDNEVSVRTHIWFNNTFGKLYLAVVKPFHNWIVSYWVKALGKPA